MIFSPSLIDLPHQWHRSAYLAEIVGPAAGGRGAVGEGAAGERRGREGAHGRGVSVDRGLQLLQAGDRTPVGVARQVAVAAGQCAVRGPHGVAAVHQVTAGHLRPSEDSGRSRARLAIFAMDDLTAEEEEELLKYLAFLRSRAPS